MRIMNVGCNSVSQTRQNYNNKSVNSPNFKCGIIGSVENPEEMRKLFSFMWDLGHVLGAESKHGFNLNPGALHEILELGNDSNTRKLIPYVVERLNAEPVLQAHGATFEVYGKRL